MGSFIPLTMKRRPSSSSSFDANGIYTRTRASTSTSTVGKRRRGQDPVIHENDLISKLPDDLLQVILSKLSTEEAVRTSMLSSRWVHLWKCRPDLVLDMRSVFKSTLLERENIARSLNKVMKNHIGNLESCTIYHHSYQTKETLERWIQSATRVKNTKVLTIESHTATIGPYYGYNELFMSPKIFSHHSLTSLSLLRFELRPQCFEGCSNLKTLKLLNVIIDASGLNAVLAACSSLEVLLLQSIFLTEKGALRVENNNLKYLQVSTNSPTDRIEVYALRLEVLDVRWICCAKKNFIVVAPNLKFNRTYTSDGKCPHLGCNISYLTKVKKNIWYELMMSGLHEVRRCGSLSVSIDITNPEEVEVLKELLLMWGINMNELEIVFKNNPKEEGECSTTIGREYEYLWEKTSLFFHICTVWMHNFSGSNMKEFEFASQFVKAWPKTLIRKLMIETSSFSPMKKLKVEAEVAKLMAISEGDKDPTIQCF